MYFLSAVLMIACSLTCCLFPDTKDKILDDTFKEENITIKSSVTVEPVKTQINENDAKL